MSGDYLLQRGTEMRRGPGVKGSPLLELRRGFAALKVTLTSQALLSMRLLDEQRRALDANHAEFQAATLRARNGLDAVQQCTDLLCAVRDGFTSQQNILLSA